MPSIQIPLKPGVEAPDKVPRVEAVKMMDIGFDAAADRMEQAGPAFFDRVVTMYDQIAAAESDRFCVIDGSGSIEEIEEAVWADILTLAPDLAS